MIEELKLLIPLLQQAGEGVFWVVLTYFGLEAFKAVLWFLIFYLAFVCIYKTFTYSHEKSLKRSKLQKARDVVRELWLYGSSGETKEKARDFYYILNKEVKDDGDN